MCATEDDHHFIFDCPNTDDSEKKRLIQEYCLHKKYRKVSFDKGVGRSSRAKHRDFKAFSDNSSA